MAAQLLALLVGFTPSPDDQLVEIVQRFAQETGDVVVFPVGTPRLRGKLGLPFAGLPRIDSWPVCRAILAFDEIEFRERIAPGLHAGRARGSPRTREAIFLGGPSPVRLRLSGDACAITVSGKLPALAPESRVALRAVRTCSIRWREFADKVLRLFPAEPPAGARTGSAPIRAGSEARLDRTIHRWAQQAGVLLVVPAGSRRLSQRFGAGFDHRIRPDRFWETVCAILAFYEVEVRPAVPADVFVGFTGGDFRRVVVYGGPKPIRLELRPEAVRLLAWRHWRPRVGVRRPPRPRLGGPQLAPGSLRRIRTMEHRGFVERIFRARLLAAFGEPDEPGPVPRRRGWLRVDDDGVWLRHAGNERPDLRPGRHRIAVDGLDLVRFVECRYPLSTLGQVPRLRRGALTRASEIELALLERWGSRTDRRAARLLRSVYGTLAEMVREQPRREGRGGQGAPE